jgi:hypothetical protein
MVRPAIDRGPIGGGAARQAAKDELSHRDYHRDDPGLTSRVVQWIGRRLGELFTGGTGSHAVLLVLVALLAAVILFAVRAGAPRRSRPLAVAGAADLLAAVPARDHRRIAAQLAAEGRRTEAVREWLRAAVATIEERGVLPPRPGRTGAATAREAGPLLPSAAGDLRAATAAFDEIWFGGRAATNADVARAQAAADAVRSARMATVAGPGLAVPQ